MPLHRDEAAKLGLPIRPFLFTLDQIAAMLEVSLVDVTRFYIHFEGRSVGAKPRDKMSARNIAPADMQPAWRVAEQELVRWLKVKGFRFYEKGWVRS